MRSTPVLLTFGIMLPRKVGQSFTSWLPLKTSHITICDAIYRNHSRKSNMWHFQFFISLKSSLGEVRFAENPTWIGPVVPKIKHLKDSQNNRKQKKNIPFSGYILTINAPNFWLIPLDRNTLSSNNRDMGNQFDSLTSPKPGLQLDK